MPSPNATQRTVFQSFNQYGGIELWGLGRESPYFATLPIWWGGFLLSTFDITPMSTFDYESVVGVKPGNSDVVIEYQVDEFTCNWLAECFVA